jgi:phosphate transport system substrate-binding protein
MKEQPSVIGKIRRPLVAAALIPLAVGVAACSSGGGGNSPSSSPSAAAKMQGPALPSKPASATASMTETGSTLLFPLVSAWATDYQKLYKQLTITTGGTGSGTGITDASTGTVDIGASDAYLSSADKSAHPSLLNIALAISAQQINYNIPHVKSGLKLDGAVLAGIYSGKITTWNAPQITALNPGMKLPSLKIVPLRRLDSSGDTFLFTSYLNAQSPSAWGASNVGTTVSWPSVPGELSETGNGGMVSGCGATKGCIAYIGISYLAKTQAAGLGQAVLKNAAGKYVAPTSATVSAAAAAQTAKTPPNETISLINGPGANSYPIINYEYAIVNTKQTNPTTAEDMRAFLHWAVHSGQSMSTYLSTVNFQALPSKVVGYSDAQIAKIGS